MGESEKSVADLEREGDIAADYLEGFLDLADLDGNLDIGVVNGRSNVAITGGGEDLNLLGVAVVVNALQDLTRQVVQRETGQFCRLILDIEGSRSLREQELRREVDHAIAQLIAGRESIKLAQMSSYERKIVHDYVSERGFSSVSFGEGINRRLVISKSE
ncbi:DNA-binding protein [Canibacter sp. lx-72]|uniref:Jag family protein n=1 Tax=Canibacter zhuwentaonis TaxID=2837491 RepID=UPI001BDBC0E4|nr:R3H domain-containing nucleic acid-binding protein [Canibacter zhuwentaonis]MBT1018116.1 DNA-binding protein [Canibacter zhuwentaonis]MBT1035349.1 DNA-binding protein [Canibacter zhuwentaonis]